MVTSLIPADPNERDFRLEDDLSKFRRVKKHGLPERFRLFYTFSSVQRVIIPLYLNDANTLRKSGAASDPYEIFKRMVRRGDVGSDFEANWKEWLATNKRLAMTRGQVGPHEGQTKSPPKKTSDKSGKSIRRFTR